MKVLIVEDEKMAARRLQRMVLEIDDQIEILATLDSIDGVINWVKNEPHPDLIFMDIHLADGSCFDIFNHVDIQKPIIFTTAYDEYAIQAFQVNAIDYLLKPIKPQALEKAIEKYQKQQPQQPAAQSIDLTELSRLLQRQKNINRFLIRIGQNFKTVEVKEAAYFYTENKITFLMSKEGKRYPVDYSLEKLETFLPPQSFFRINRQFIVCIDAIGKMYAVSKSRVKLEMNPSASIDTIVSTERSGKFKRWLTGEY